MKENTSKSYLVRKSKYSTCIKNITSQTERFKESKLSKLNQLREIGKKEIGLTFNFQSFKVSAYLF